MELDRSSWPRKKMELDRSTASGLSALLRPLVGGCAVPVVLAAQRCTAGAAKKPRVSPGSDGAIAIARQRSRVTNKAEAERAVRTRHAPAKRVARRMLRRGGAAAAAEHEGGRRRVVLACCCPRLPPGMRCALHQGVAGATREPCRRGGWAFGEYARWRRSVWMPSRFYLERVGEATTAGRSSGQRVVDRPALLVERSGTCVRRFVFVGDTELASQEM